MLVSLQVVGFMVLLSGTSVYNEILRTCLPAAEPRRQRQRQRSGRTAAEAVDAEAALQQPLLLGQADFAEQQQQPRTVRPQGSNAAAGVRFAEVPAPSRPIAAGRHSGADHARYTMARQAVHDALA